MNEYMSDNWAILKITTHKETVYKVLAGFAGGYTSGRSWKLNSGIVSVTETGESYEFCGSSGSVYICRKNCQHLDWYTQSIGADLIDRINESRQGTAEFVEVEEVLNFLNTVDF